MVYLKPNYVSHHIKYIQLKDIDHHIGCKGKIQP